jgi:hypothetical protein
VVSICAFGGGPGTELLGLSKWAERTKPQQPIHLEYLLLDKVGQWLGTWRAIQKRIEAKFKKHISKNRFQWPVLIKGDFSPVNIKDRSGLVNWGDIFDQDIYILSYLISEIFEKSDDFRAFTQGIADHAPKGAKFLFVDRKGQCWKREIVEVARQADIELSGFNDMESSINPKTEEVKDLGLLPKEVGILPKLRWKAFWVVGTKK